MLKNIQKNGNRERARGYAVLQSRLSKWDDTKAKEKKMFFTPPKLFDILLN